MTRGLLLTGSLNDHLKPRLCTLYVLKIGFMQQSKPEKETVLKKVIRKRKCTYGMTLYLWGKKVGTDRPAEFKAPLFEGQQYFKSRLGPSVSGWRRHKGDLYTKNTQTHF